SSRRGEHGAASVATGTARLLVRSYDRSIPALRSPSVEAAVSLHVDGGGSRDRRADRGVAGRRIGDRDEAPDREVRDEVVVREVEPELDALALLLAGGGARGARVAPAR